MINRDTDKVDSVAYETKMFDGSDILGNRTGKRVFELCQSSTCIIYIIRTQDRWASIHDTVTRLSGLGVKLDCFWKNAVGADSVGGPLD